MRRAAPWPWPLAAPTGNTRTSRRVPADMPLPRSPRVRLARALGAALLVAAVAACSTPGRQPTPSPTVTPSPSASAAVGLTRDEAVALARKAAGRFANDDVLEARVGTWGELDRWTPPSAPPTPAPDTRIWIVNIGYNPGPLMGQGTIVVLDYFDGHVLNATEWIS